MEDRCGQVGHLLAGHVARWIGADRVGGVGVAPADIAPDVEGPIASLGQGGVLVARKVGEGTAGDLDQLEVGPAAGVPGNPHPFAVPLQVERRRRSVVSVAGEEDLRGGEPVTVVARHERRGEGKLTTGHRQPLHVRVGGEEVAADVEEPALERRGARAERRGVHEVLHRVGGDYQAIVAVRIRGQEGRAVDGDFELGRHEDILATGERGFGNGGHAAQRGAVRAIDLHIGLAIPNLVGHVSASSSVSGSPRRDRSRSAAM